MTDSDFRVLLQKCDQYSPAMWQAVCTAIVKGYWIKVNGTSELKLQPTADTELSYYPDTGNIVAFRNGQLIWSTGNSRWSGLAALIEMADKLSGIGSH